MPRFAPGARGEEVLDLRVGLGVAELGRDVDDDELGHREPERARELAREDLGDERRPRPAPRRVNFVTYMPSSSASSRPGSEPPSRSGFDVARGGDAAQRLGHRAQASQAARCTGGCVRAPRAGYAVRMIIAGVAAFCVVLLVLAFLFPRLSRGPERAGSKVVGVGQRGAGKAPGKAGHWLAKPFQTAQKAIFKSGRAGRRGRSKMPL